jgi:hypothetical protein
MSPAPPGRSLALSARGMTVREIRAFLAERYVVEAPRTSSAPSPRRCRRRSGLTRVEPMYPVVAFDAGGITIRDEGTVHGEAVCGVVGGDDAANVHRPSRSAQPRLRHVEDTRRSAGAPSMFVRSLVLFGSLLTVLRSAFRSVVPPFLSSAFRSLFFVLCSSFSINKKRVEPAAG